ncbi:nucleotide pyrophosphatase [Renibacterium salmoninarum ATCC 33209]|uniref:Nucleotide pyrophosphatase n=1 Tax=Renibacterium salmoninarum (strain ATCC 33209 / DSM 20767 / JCM 11484 / NBRC 15589 / NCIMB 2235) TaxID=288705 RepID=A9WRC7_RENSM|nr:nucleotide pyrophosphatase [Renibacterium salmoninarum ATCC 33209]
MPESPGYGAASLASVLTSSAAAMGASRFENLLGLPAARRVCVVLVDGLGSALLKRKIAHAPFLRSVLTGNLAGGVSRTINSAFPSTTASSLSSLGTGVAPGLHGMVGYDVLDPSQDEVVNLLGNWDAGVDPLSWQPYPTVFEQLEGIFPTATVSLPKFADSAMTRAALRGSRFVAAGSAHARTAAAAELMAAEPELLMYFYWSELDKAGHRRGVDSAQWEHELEELDAAVKRLSEQLPPGTLLLLTADHGMVDVPESQRVDYSATPELVAGVRHTAGEPRLVQLYLEADADPEALAAAWRSAWGAKAWVLSRAEAVAKGYFGEVRPEVLGRIGDLLIAAREPVAFYDLRRVSAHAMAIVGQHGSLTKAERAVPLLQIPVQGPRNKARTSRRG